MTNHMIRIWNTYCFSTAAVIARTLLNVTLHEHWLSFYVQRRHKNSAFFLHKVVLNLLAPELFFFLILAHPVYRM